MHPLTQQTITELDMLYSLYQMAVDLVKKIKPDDEDLTLRILDARKKILDRSGEATVQVLGLLKTIQAEKWIPSNEKALVEEKRSLVLDLSLKMQATDNQVFRLMQAKMQSVRGELAMQTERKNGIKAYIQAPRAMLHVQ